jgi:hypothetical protein
LVGNTTAVEGVEIANAQGLGLRNHRFQSITLVADCAWFMWSFPAQVGTALDFLTAARVRGNNYLRVSLAEPLSNLLSGLSILNFQKRGN